MPTLPRHAALPAVRTASLWLFVSERPFAVPLCSPGVWRPAQYLRLWGQMPAFVSALPLRAPPRPRPGAERAPPPAVPCRPLFFHPLPAYGQRLVAPSAHLIPLEKCSEWMIIPLEKCIFVPEIPENVMLKRKIEQAPHSRFLLAQREPPITKQGTYP